MVTASIGANSVASALLRLVGAVVAAWCAIAISTELLARLILARFYESWLPSAGALPYLVPAILIAITGCVFGLVLGVIFRPHPLRVAAYAGTLGALFLLLGGGVELLPSAAALAIGFVIGGATIGRITRA